MKRKTGYFISSDKIHRISYYIYFPQCEIKGVIQLVHGMCDYIKRYEDSIRIFTENGYAVIGHDQLGHGKSVNDESEYGYFGEQNGWKYLLKDTVIMSRIARKYFDTDNYILYGHSMGSLIVRILLNENPKIADRFIISSTVADIGYFTDVALLVSEIVNKKSNNMVPCVFYQNILNKYASRKIIDKKTDIDWVTRDEKERDQYFIDKMRNFSFTSKGYEDLYVLMKLSLKVEKVQSSQIPIFIIQGDNDSVGNFGKTSVELKNKLEVNGYNNVQLKLYKDARHELLHEINRREVAFDIIEFCNEIKVDKS